MAADDWMAILYLLAQPGVNVAAITVTGTGEAHCAPGVQNAQRITALAGQPDIPVACETETPLAGNHAFPDAWRAGVDSLQGIELPEGSTDQQETSAVNLLKSTIEGSDQPVTLVTLGPLTNVALALRDDPGLADKIGSIYIMGGAVNVGGNVGPSIGSDNDTAEWNIYADPQAAKEVFESNANIALVPLDATNDAPVTQEFVQTLGNAAQTPVADFVHNVLMKMLSFGDYSFWDPTAAAIAYDESLTTFESAPLTVATDEGTDSGSTIVATDGKADRYATSANLQELEQRFLAAWNAE